MKKIKHDISTINRGDIVIYKGMEYIFAHQCPRDGYVVLYDPIERKKEIPVHYIVATTDIKLK